MKFEVHRNFSKNMQLNLITLSEDEIQALSEGRTVDWNWIGDSEPDSLTRTLYKGQIVAIKKEKKEKAANEESKSDMRDAGVEIDGKR